METHRVVRRFRLVATVVVVGGLAARLVLSATSYGTNDVGYFAGFARTVRELGPIGIYNVPFDPSYNHPPLVGWMLGFVNWLTERGLGFPFALRILPIVADAAATVLMIQVARRRSDDRTALLAGATVAFGPVLILVSGLHGNFDTVFCALVLLSLFLMVDKRWAIAAGSVGALAVGVKLVPLVVIPVIALSGGDRRAFGRYAASFLVVSSAIWLPALAQEPGGVTTNVLGYRGQFGHWGTAEVATLLGVGHGALSSVRGITGILATGVSMLLGVWCLVGARYRSPYPAAAVSLAAFLFLSPSWGAQYMAWPAALLFFIGARYAAAYSIAAGGFLLVIYAAWSEGFPVEPIQTTPHVGPLGSALGLLAWVLLGITVVHACARMLGGARSTASELEHPDLAETDRSIAEPI